MPRYPRQEGADQRATVLELFYDLVFVFAVTQVSRHLLEHLTWTGALQSSVLLIAVWWSWNYTTWATNELDTGAAAVRAVVVAVMFGSLLMAVAIPEAFEGRGLLFALAYVAIQLGRTGWLAFRGARGGEVERQRASRILVWFVAAGIFWVSGGIVHGDARLLLWLVAVLVDLAGPILTYRVPGLPVMANSVWHVQAAHFAERFQLFVIIALGESVVRIGETTADLHLSAARVTAFVVAFLGTAALWWLYFGVGSERAEQALTAADAGRTSVARDAYTYLHALIVAGIILTAVGDEIVVTDPSSHLAVAQAVAVCAGPSLYLLAHAAFLRRVAGRWPWTDVLGAVVCLACTTFGTHVPALAVGIVLLAVVAAVVLVAHRYRDVLGEA